MPPLIAPHLSSPLAWIDKNSVFLRESVPFDFVIGIGEKHFEQQTALSDLILQWLPVSQKKPDASSPLASSPELVHI